MAWSSYAHLPNREEEYWEILSKINNGMSICEVDTIIAKTKGKEKVTHHYRSNLAKIGLFDIHQGTISLNYDSSRLANEKSYLKEILSGCLARCKTKEIDTVEAVIRKEKTYNISVIAENLGNKFPEIEKSNFIRWIRPITNMFRIMDILTENESHLSNLSAKYLQETYFKLSTQYGIAIALEDLNIELEKISSSYKAAELVEELLCNKSMKFKIELLMLPNWATGHKAYMINNEYYTHMKIKSNLLEVKSE